MAPPSPGRAESRDRPGIRVQLQPGGGEGPPLTPNAATRPWPREARPRRPGRGQSQSSGPLGSPPWGEGTAPQAPGNQVAVLSREQWGWGVGGASLSAAVWPDRSSPPSLWHLPSAAPKLFALAPSPRAGMQPPYPHPGVGNRERGPRAPSAGLRRPRT